MGRLWVVVLNDNVQHAAHDFIMDFVNREETKAVLPSAQSLRNQLL